MLPRALILLLASSAMALPAVASTITGSVADSAGVRPLQGAEVRIPSLGRVTNADSAGRFRFTGIPAGTYEVVVSFAGAGRESQSVTVGAEGTVQLSFALAPVGTDIETILVLGQQANLLSSLQRQRASDTVTTVLTRDAIGQFPDQNVAESLRRAPGINILNDQGEGRFVAIRGLDPNLNAASINGARVPAPESDVRSVALDVIPNELIESIEVKKSLTPDMDADTIGGSIEINTTSAFDREKGFVSASLEGSYNELSNRLTPKASVDFSARLSEDFGIAGGFSYYQRKFATDNIEMDGWETGDNGIVYAEDVEYRDYDVTRERIGGTFSFDFRASDSTTLYGRMLYSKFTDQEYRRRLIFDFGDFADEGGPTTGSGDLVDFSSATTEIGVERDHKDRFEEQTIQSYVLGGKTVANGWTLTYMGSYAQSEEQERGSVDPVVFARGFEDDELDVQFDYSDMKRPAFSILNGAALFTDPSEYEFDVLERTTVSDSRDKEWALKGDVAKEIPLSDGSFTVQGGVKARWREKRYNGDFDIFDGFDGDFTLADVQGRQTYGLADIEPVVGKSEWRDWLRANGYGQFELNDIDTTIASNAEDYRAKEDILAAYVLGRFENEWARLIAGVRVERTKTRTDGNLVTYEETTDANGDDVEIVTVTPLAFARSYTDWLPSLNLRAEAGNDLILRAGIYRSVVRPNFAQFAPRFFLEDGEAEFGNPELDPYRAWNFDLAAEWYFAPKAVLQAGLFAKSISGYIVNTELSDGSFNGVDYDEAVIPINADRGKVFGLEFAYSQAFTQLPAPFDGLLVNFNYTYTDARVDVLGRNVPLPASSRHNFNAVGGYEKGGFSFRLAGTFRDRYLDELGGDDESDRYVQPHFQLDMSARYKITKNFQIFVDLVNINNAKYTAYQRGPEQDRLLQFEEYQTTVKFGVRASF
jgi:TonB-dependent receptor